MFASPGPIVFSINHFYIYYYGILLALSIAISVFYANKIGEKFYNLKKDTIIDLAPFVIIGGILGARLYYCMLNFYFYCEFPLEIFAIRNGGISIHGALLGGAFAIFLYSKYKKIMYLKLCDIFAICLPLGQAIGRWGNFFNSEAFGLPTNLPWKLFIDEQYRPIPYQNVEYFHPTFLYESLLNLLIFIIFMFFLKKISKLKQGNISLVYLILYSLIRIFTENLRLDSAVYVGAFPIAIVVSISIIVIAILLLIVNNKEIFNKKEFK